MATYASPYDQRQSRARAGGERLARALGWFSIGLGLAEVAAPRRFATSIGVPERHKILSSVGLREIASGIGILARRRPAGWLWARVAGDAMDLALLGAALRSRRSDTDKVTKTTAAVVGVTALDLFAGRWLRRKSGRASRRVLPDGSIHFQKSIRINASPEVLYAFWRDFQNLPRFMQHLDFVQVTSGTRSHWVAKAPGGVTVEWDAEIIGDVPNESIEWRSVEGSEVDNRGSVRFERPPNGRGAIVRVEIQYKPPGGRVGAVVAKLFGDEPAQQVYEDLRRFKQVVETGEIATNAGPAGRRGGRHIRRQRSLERQQRRTGS